MTEVRLSVNREQPVKIPAPVSIGDEFFITRVAHRRLRVQLSRSCSLKPASSLDPLCSQTERHAGGAAVMEVRPGAAATEQMDGPVVVTCLTGTIIWRWLGAHLNNWFSTFHAEDGGKAFRLPVEQESAETVKSVSACGNKLCR